MITESKLKVSEALRLAIDVMHSEMMNEFGIDFAYTIVGSGSIIGASNQRQGYVRPQVRVEEAVTQKYVRMICKNSLARNMRPTKKTKKGKR